MTLRSTEASSSEYEIDDTRRPEFSRGYGDNAEALRRRADALLDEMMLGGVDIGAGEGLYNGVNGDATAPSLANGHHQPDDDGRFNYGDNGIAEYAVEFTDPDLAPAPAEQPPARPTNQDTRTGALAAPGQAGSAREPADTRPATPVSSPPTGRDSGTPHLVAAEDRYPRPADPSSPRAEYANGDRSAPTSAVRRQAASYASSMTVGPRANLRSSLLPRSVETDTATAEQEIHALMSEISAALPVGHEAAERSRHLLNKAENILQSDPTRTAEVDYYLQQVRRIVQRTRQTQTWSALYQRRLTIYLAAWVALSVTVLAGRYLLQAEFLAFLEEIFWTSADSIWVQFAPMTIGAIAAGSLGSATGVLLNMQRHAAQEYGYFDRKYGLRGLLLPLLGCFFGLVLALLWAALCYFVGLDGTNLWIASAPAIVALLLGFGQEWLYGAR